MKDPTCGECMHFRQHYILFGERFSAAGCGHCVYPRLKHRKPTSFACVYFQQKEKTTNTDIEEQP